MPGPVTPTDAIFPDWVNLSDTWREQDAEWLRNRSTQMFTTDAIRNTIMTGKTLFGMMSILPVGSALAAGGVSLGGPDFWNGTIWESVRYPNVNVASAAGPPASVTFKYQGAGSGVQLLNEAGGSVNIAHLIAGAGLTTAFTGSLLDNTGIAIKVGTKTVKLSTGATDLLIDSPVSITGALGATGLATLGSLSVTGAATVTGLLTASAGVTASGQAVTAATVTGTTSVTGGDAQLATSGVYGQLKHRTGGTAVVGVGSDSTVKIDGNTILVNPAATLAAALTVNGQTNFVGRPVFAMPSTVATWVAGVYAQANTAPGTTNCPDGTIWISF